MLNYIWLGLVVLAVVIGGCTDSLKAVADKSFEVAIKKTSYALLAGLFADFVGVVASVIVCRLVFR